MGTRSLTHFKDDGKILCTIYRQFDGYPSGHGKELAEFLSSGEQVNGIGDTSTRVFNGMGCLAAQVIWKLKDGEAGNIYVQRPGAKDCGEDYVYTIAGGFDRNPLVITVKNPNYQIFKGSLPDFLEFCNKPDDE